MRKTRKRMATLLAMSTLATTLSGFHLYAMSPLEMDVWVQDAASRIFEGTTEPLYAEQNIRIHTAKNEYEAMQIAVRSNQGLKDVVVGISDLLDTKGNVIKKENIEVFRETFHLSTNITGDIEVAPDGTRRYADALVEVSDEGPISIEANKTQPYWIRVYTDATQEAGLYTGVVAVKTGESIKEIPVEVEVYDVTLPRTNESEFKMNNWFGSVGWDYAGTQESILKQYNVKLYDENWWRVITNIAKDFQIHRNNVIYIDFQALLIPHTSVDQEGKYQFGWESFDKMVKIFVDAGALQYIYTPHLLEKAGNKSKLEMIKPVNGQMQRVLVDCNTAESNEYLAQLIPELRTHLTALGNELGVDLINHFYISAMDEPDAAAHVEGSKWFYEVIKQYFPEAQTAEAHHRNTKGLEDHLTTFVPKLNTYEENRAYYQDLLNTKNKELWLYACIGLDGDYLNRYLPYHLAKARLFPWYVYQIGGTGFLHFGYNYWNGKDTFNYDQTGDEWLVRPNKEKYDIYTSVRHEAQLDGVEDFELLKILEKQNPKVAKKIADNIIKSGTEYIREGNGVTKAHKLLLDAITNQGQVNERIAIPVFKDTFEGKYDTAWTRNSGKWSIVEQGYEANGAQSEKVCMTSATGWNIGDGEVSFDLTIKDAITDSVSGGAGVVFHKNNIQDTHLQSGYLVQLNSQGRLVLAKGEEILAETTINIEPINRITISNLEGQIKVYANGKKEAVISVNDATYSKGYISLVSNGVDARFDNVGLASYEEFMKPSVDKSLIIDSGYKDYFRETTLSNWVMSEGVTFTNEELQIEGTGTAALNKRIFKDAKITFDMTFNEKAEQALAGITFRKSTQLGEIEETGGYFLGISPSGEVQLKCGNNVIATGQVEEDLTQKFKVKIELDGPMMGVWINESEGASLLVSDTTFEEGFISFEGENTNACFDNLSIEAVKQDKKSKLIDDFSQGLSKWKAVADEAYVKIEGEKLILKGENGDNGGKSPEVVLKDQVIQNGTISFDVKIPQTQSNDSRNWAAITVRSPGDQGIWNSGGYLIHYRANGILEVYGTEGAVTGVDTGVKPVDQFVNVKVQMEDDKVSIFINNEATPILTFRDKKFEKGYISLKADSATAEFDNVLLSVGPEAIDDFDQDLSKWKILKNEECINIQEGTLRMNGVTEKGDSPEIVLKDQVMQDGVISFDMKINETFGNKDTNWGGCYIRTGGDTGYWNHGGYLIYYRANGIIEVYSGGVIGSADTGVKPVDGLINVKVEMKDSKMKIFINNGAAPIIELENANYEKGYFGLMSDFANVEYDNVKAEGLTAYIPDIGGDIIQDEPL